MGLHLCNRWVGGYGFLKRGRGGVPVVFLNRLYSHPSLQGFNGIDNGLCTGEGGDAGNIMGNGLTSYGHFICLGFLSAGSVNDQMNLPVFDLIDDIRPAFAHLKNRMDRNTVVRQDLRRSFGGYDLKSEINQFLGEKDDGPFILVHHADEDLPF